MMCFYSSRTRVGTSGSPDEPRRAAYSHVGSDRQRRSTDTRRAMVCPRSAGRSQLPRTARAAFGWDSGAAVSRVTATAVSLCSPKPTVRRLETLARSDFDRTGRLWIGGLGVSRVDNPESERPTFVRYTTSQGLASNYVHSLAEDLSGRMYLGMTSGVDRLDPVTGVVRHFALPDGLSGSEVEVAFCDRHGTLWFGTARGLASLVPLPDGPASPPTVFIGGLRISGETRSISELGETQVQALELGPSQNQVQIDYFSSKTPGVATRYMLENADRDWSGPTEQRSVNYASLSPGRYRLRRSGDLGGWACRSCTGKRRLDSAPLGAWGFPRGHEVLIYAVHRLRVSRLLELERVRTRIATDLHDDIGLSLTQIAILSEVAERRLNNRILAVAQPIRAFPIFRVNSSI